MPASRWIGGKHQLDWASRARIIAPTRLLSLCALLSAAASLACVLLATAMPWLGMDLQAQQDRSAPPQVLRARGPAQGIQAEASVLALEAGGERLNLRGDDLAPEPDMAFPAYADFEAFMQRQDRIARVMRAPRMTLHLSGGAQVDIVPEAHRPLTDLDWQFWFQLFCGQSCFVVAGALWAFRRSDPAARWCLVAGTGGMFSASSAAIYSTRELALPSAMFDALSALNHLGTAICCAGFVTVLFFHPKPLLRRGHPGPIVAMICASVWLLERLQWLPTGMASANLLIVLGYLLSLVLGGWQWSRVRGDLRARAALQWFLVSWLFGSGILMFVVLVPALAGYDMGEFQAYGLGALLVSEVGVVLGVARYRLFDLEIWWYRAVLLIVGAFAVLLLDVLFTSLLHLGASSTLTLSLLVAGWLYFPLRQWLSQRFFTGARRVQIDEVPNLLREALSRQDAPADQLLPDTLRRLFAPLQLQSLNTGANRVSLIDDGLALRVPGIGGHGCVELRFAAEGRRLFNRRDVSLAAAVQAVLDRFGDYQSALERGVEKERARVAQDLHDDVGARLLTLLHQSDDHTATIIRDAIDSLRLTVYGLVAQTRPLADALATLRAEAEDRCEAAAVPLHWIEDGALPEIALDSAQQQDLARVLREALSNALRHARPSAVTVRIRTSSAQLAIELEHDGVASAPGDWRSGTGLRGMRMRTQRIGGTFSLSGGDGRVSLRLALPFSGRAFPPNRGQTADDA